MDYHDSLSRRKGMRRLSVVRLIRSSYLFYFAQPAADRALYWAIKRKPIRTIVELGIGMGQAANYRTERLLEVASWRRDCLPLAYTAIDLFESRPADQPRITLKAAFHDLRATGVKARLVPGDPYAALVRTANSLTGTDLLIVPAEVDQDSLAQAWRFVPRMIHAQTLVFQQDAASELGKASWRQLSYDEVLRLAEVAQRAIRRAA
jgi:Fructose-1,6-bisphosphatase/sedoheptulose 1,7-bisphosphatase and related proteins